MKKTSNMFYREKKEIITWLDKYKVKNYTLVPDKNYGYMVDVAGSVFLMGKSLTEIPVKFGHVDEQFNCSHNQLTSLKGCPQNVGGSFSCYDNALSSLEFAPHSVKGAFICSDNQLISLKGCPQSVGGNFYCNDNQLTSLEGSPQSVGKDFLCYRNQLNSLEGMPEVVEGRFFCDKNPALGELQKMESFQEIKAYFLSKKLAMELAHDLGNQKNNSKIKL